MAVPLVAAGAWVVRSGVILLGLYMISWTVDSVEKIAEPERLRAAGQLGIGIAALLLALFIWRR